MVRVRVCSHCKEPQPPENFHKKSRNKDGLFPLCKICGLKNKREWVEANYEKQLLGCARDRARRFELEFTIDVTDIVIPELCPYLKIPLCKTQGRGHNMDAPSLDRIDNTKGYIKGNVEVISKQANYMKNVATPEQLNTFAKSILERGLPAEWLK